MVTWVNIDDIVIERKFLNSTPSEQKYRRKLNQYLSTGTYKNIELDKDGKLTDGYITYLIFKQLGNNRILCEVSDSYGKERTYVYGVHPGNPTKERVWYASKRFLKRFGEVNVGDALMASAKGKIAPIIVTKVEILTKAPIDLKIKPVVSRAKGRVEIDVNSEGSL